MNAHLKASGVVAAILIWFAAVIVGASTSHGSIPWIICVIVIASPLVAAFIGCLTLIYLGILDAARGR